MKNKGLKNKNCTMGANCGGSCIAKNKACTSELSLKQKNKIIAAVKKLIESVISKFKKPVDPNFITIKKGKPISEGVYGIVTGNDSQVLKTLRPNKNPGSKPMTIGDEAKIQSIAAKLGVAPKVLASTNTQILMEKAKGITAYKAIAFFKNSQEESDFQAAKGEAMLTLHKAKIAHNDAHDKNMFYDRASKKVTFIDFGLAQQNATAYSRWYEYEAGISDYVKNKYGKTFKNADAYSDWLDTL